MIALDEIYMVVVDYNGMELWLQDLRYRKWALEDSLTAKNGNMKEAQVAN